MQTWAKRGIQTALVTGGLLMLGTGIASADENVSPDRPASALDGSLAIPINLDNNVIGTPLGTIETPEMTNDDIAIDDVSTPELGDVALAGDVLRGNSVDPDLAVPVDISGNAIAVLSPACVENDSSQSVQAGDGVTTNGSGDLLAGNVVDLDYALPVQISNNAVGGLSDACSSGTASQDAAAGGDLTTDGSLGTLSGNLLAGHGATPVQVTGNAVAGGGTATTDSEASTTGEAGGIIRTDGDQGFGTGNAGAVPLAVPVELNDNALAGLGAADAGSTSAATAQAGAEAPGTFGVPTYMQTSGTPGALAGNIAQPAVAGPAAVNCNAGSALGISDASCENTTDADAGGTNRSNGAESLLSGTIGHAAVAMPAEGFCNAGGLGDATVDCDNTVDSDAGGQSYTRGHEGTLSGSLVDAPVSGPGDVFCNVVGGLGTSTADCENDAEVSSGGHNGTTGSDSAGGGNMVSTPVALPTEGFGNVVSAAGTGAITGSTETKVVNAGGGSNTDDDGGLGAANVGQVPVSGPVQVFGNGGGVLGNTSSASTADNTVTAGGISKATGTAGTLAGNIGQAPVTLPAQVFGNGATAGGIGTVASAVETTSKAGGIATTDGTAGAGSGNVATVPVGSAAQLFDNAGAALGQQTATGESTTVSTAGGTTDTSGQAGFLSGNVAAGQALPVAQGFGDALSGLGGQALAIAGNDTTANSGGDITTNGDAGTISGNLVDVPAAAEVAPFGDAVAVFGSLSDATADSASNGTAGGTSTTSGVNGFLSGLDGTVPLGAHMPVYDIPLEVFAEALAQATHSGMFTSGGGDMLIDMPVTGSTLPATELPSLSSRGADGRDLPVPGGDLLGGIGGLGGLGGVTGLLGGLTGGGVPDVGSVTGLLGGALPGGGALPALPGGGALPALPGGGALPGLPGGGALPGLPTGGLTGALPSMPKVPGLPGEVTTVLPAVQPRAAAPAPSGVPQVPGLPDTPEVGALTGLPFVGSVFDGLEDGGMMSPSSLPGLPGLTEVPGMPTLPDAANLPGLPDVTAVPSVPELPGLADAPVVQAPTLDQLPLPLEGPALSGLDTTEVLDVIDVSDGSSLADTRAKLASLFSHHPIG